MNKENQIKQQIQELSKQTKALHDQLEVVRAKKMLACPQCDKRTMVSKWTCISISKCGYAGAYEDPWYDDGYHIFCPKCEDFSRARTSSTVYNNGPETLHAWIKEHRWYFGENLGLELGRDASFRNLTIADIRTKNKDNETFITR